MELENRGTKMTFDVKRASEAQLELSKRVKVYDCFDRIKTVGGLDVSYRKDVGVSVLSIFEGDEIKKILYVKAKVPIPYVPGFLAFREAPLHLTLLMKFKPTITMIDGHGIAHPRGLGIASHVGVVLDIPTIGVAKRRLYGQEELCDGKECLVDERGKLLAYIISKGKRKLYVSPGHCVSHETALEVVKRYLRYSLPEPIRVSDMLSRRLAKGV